MPKCCYRGCSFEHKSETQVKLHEAMSRHCACCQRSDLEVEFTLLTLHDACDSCTVELEWASEGKDE